MKTNPLNIVGGFYKDETLPFAAQDCCGYLPVMAEVDGTRTPTMLKTPPGLRPFAEPTDSQPTRGAWNCEGKYFTVIGNQLYQMSNAGVFIPLGVVPGVSQVSMSHNQQSQGQQLQIVNGSAGYIYNTFTQVFQRITDTGFPGSLISLFIGGYFVGIDPRGRFAFTSAAANGLEYNTLDRFTSEYKPDKLVTGLAIGGELLLLSETSGEFFAVTSSPQQPMRTKQIYMDKGCAGTFTANVMDNTGYWLGDDGVFYKLNGYSPVRISTQPIEQALRELLSTNPNAWRQARCFVWEDSGHSVCYWTFPGGLTWGYDAATGVWHRRESLGMSIWRVFTATFFNSQWYAADYQSGKVWVMDWDYILEGDEEFVSQRTTQVIHDNQNRLVINRLELLMQVGQEETTPVDFPVQPDPPEVTGAYPDGSIGVENAAFPYIASGGTPPYTFSIRPGNNPAPGIPNMASTGIVPIGTPTDNGAYQHSLRVTDQTGLFADHLDPYTVSAMVLALGTPTGLGSSWAVMQVPDTTDWDNAVVSIAESHQMLAVDDGRVLVWGNTDYIYSDDLGQTFSAPVSGLGSLVGPRQGVINDSVIVIPGNNVTARTYRSTDNGLTFTPVDQGTNFLWRAVNNGADIYFNSHSASNSRFYVSNDLGMTTSAGGATNLVTSGGDALASFGGKVVCGGRNVANNFPGVSVTEDGGTVENHDVNGDVNQYTSAICGAEVAGVERWVIGLSNGKIYWTEDFLTFTQWATSLTGVVNAIVWDGSNFLVGGDNTTYVLTSPDGKVGTQRTPNALSDNISNIVVVE